MKQLLTFLHDLSEHNDREWFNAHKDEYRQVRSYFSALTDRVVEGLRTFDESIGPLTSEACMYRIYRDLRFTPDKTPYKTSMSAFINRGGKKSGYSGYYFHVSGTGEHMVAIGDIWCEPAVLKVLREDIELGRGDFRRILSQVDSRLKLDTDGSLKKVPHGFPADSPDAGFFKLKHFCLYFVPDDKFILSRTFPDQMLEIFRSAKPFLDFVNRAIEYCREEAKA